ncbi:MAG: response regulator [Verrucomicrobiota bacterium]
MKVLSIDDSKIVHRVVTKALKNFDVEVLTAPNGMEGFIKARQEIPDLIVLDVNMPIMNGYETLEKLKQTSETAAIPVIMMTSEEGAKSQERAFEAGTWMYLVKPFEDDVFINSVMSLIPLAPRAEQA